MRLFQRALLAFSFLIVAVNSNAQLAVLDGNWYSTQWKYGYVLKDGVGMATSTNSPNFQVGQNIIQLTATSPNTFTGQQVYTDGKFYKVNAKLQTDGRLYFEGEKNAKWVMDRIGAAPQASVQSSQSTQPTTSAAASASTSPSFDCRKATTAVEKLICSNAELSKLDISLAETYKEAVSKDRSIRDDQRAWNAEKNKCADIDCLKSAYEDRISELTNFIVRHDRAALNQGQANTNTSTGGSVKSDNPAARSTPSASLADGAALSNNPQLFYELGICYQAMLKLSERSDRWALSAEERAYVTEKGSRVEPVANAAKRVLNRYCPQGPDEACARSIPENTKAYFSGNGAVTESFNSAGHNQLIKTGTGNNPLVQRNVMKAYCDKF